MFCSNLTFNFINNNCSAFMPLKSFGFGFKTGCLLGIQSFVWRQFSPFSSFPIISGMSPEEFFERRNASLNYSTNPGMNWSDLSLNLSTYNVNTVSPTLYNSDNLYKEWVEARKPSALYSNTEINSTIQINSSDLNKEKYSQTINYGKLTRADALEKAKNDPNLEKLVTTTSSKGHKVIISSVDFENDIPYAKKGTMEILLKVADKIGKDITITSALGTSSSPHEGKDDQTGHYNPTNPKLDFGGGLNTAEAEELETALENTGYFEFVNPEANKDGTGYWHLDLKINEDAYSALA